MRLVFSLLPPDIQNRKNDIAACVAGAFPGAMIAFDDLRGHLIVTLPHGADPSVMSVSVCRALAEIGVTAKPAIGDGFGAPPAYSEPIKKGRTVSLSAYIVSMIAVALVVSMLTFVFAGGFSTVFQSLGMGAYEETLGTGDQEGENYAGKIAQIDRIFEEYSLYDTDGKLLLDAMLKAYAESSGDRYAAYYTEEEYRAMMSDQSGNLVGIGISAIKDAETGAILIVDVLPDSPAESAGLQVGDLIIAIGSGENQALVSELGYEVAIDRMLGEVGTKAEFTVSRDGEEIFYAVERAVVKRVLAKATVSATDPTVGIVRIAQFDVETPTQFKAAMEELKQAGCTKIVFDVRNNPGGDLKSISAVLSYFLEKNQTILSTVTKDGQTTIYTAVANTYTDNYAPCSVSEEEIGMYRSFIGSMAVLTNENTASAAELFTAALKDYDLATIVGTKTFGKGVIQSVIPLDRWGYDGAVKLTFGYYNPPISENYDGKGIEPDVSVSLSEEASKKSLYILPESEDAQLLAAIAALNAN